MTRPMEKARRRPMIDPILPPVSISVAIVSVNRVMALWMPVIVVPTSAATVAIDTFMTDVSRIIRNWATARTSSTPPAAAVALAAVGCDVIPADIRVSHSVGLGGAHPASIERSGYGSLLTHSLIRDSPVCPRAPIAFDDHRRRRGDRCAADAG